MLWEEEASNNGFLVNIQARTTFIDNLHRGPPHGENNETGTKQGQATGYRAMGNSPLRASRESEQKTLVLKDIQVILFIENGLHYVKDVTMGEDRSTVHADNGPKIMAALRNTALSLLRLAGVSTIAARLRYNCGHPQAALYLLSLS